MTTPCWCVCVCSFCFLQPRHVCSTNRPVFFLYKFYDISDNTHATYYYVHVNCASVVIVCAVTSFRPLVVSEFWTLPRLRLLYCPRLSNEPASFIAAALYVRWWLPVCNISSLLCSCNKISSSHKVLSYSHIVCTIPTMFKSTTTRSLFHSSYVDTPTLQNVISYSYTPVPPRTPGQRSTNNR